MSSPMEEFLTELGRRGYEPLLATASGTIRFDVHRGGRTEHRLVTVDRGSVTVTSAKSNADAVVDADAVLYDRIAGGEVNAMAAVLRGTLHVEGDTELLIQIQRIFPGPSAAASAAVSARSVTARTKAPVAARTNGRRRTAERAAPR